MISQVATDRVKKGGREYLTRLPGGGHTSVLFLPNGIIQTGKRPCSRPVERPTAHWQDWMQPLAGQFLLIGGACMRTPFGGSYGRTKRALAAREGAGQRGSRPVVSRASTLQQGCGRMATDVDIADVLVGPRSRPVAGLAIPGLPASGKMGKRRGSATRKSGSADRGEREKGEREVCQAVVQTDFWAVGDDPRGEASAKAGVPPGRDGPPIYIFCRGSGDGDRGEGRFFAFD
jgi:hypothetical protein